MKSRLPPPRPLWRTISVLTSVLLGSGLLPVQALTVTKKFSNNNLNTGRSWVGGKVPGLSDIALWDSGITAALASSLGGNLSWAGLKITNPNGAITINAGNTLTLGASGIDMSAATVNFNLNCAVSLRLAQTWSVNSGRTLAASGVISGTANLTKTGLGVLTLSGANTYTGSTTISAGTISVSGSGGLGGGTSALTIAPTGVFQSTATFSTGRALVLGGTGGSASGGTVDVAASTAQTRSGVISGAGSLTKTGTGALVLSAANTFTGGLYINAGSVVTSNNQALGPQSTQGSALYATYMANGTTLQTWSSTTADTRQLDLLSGTATLDVVAGTSQQRNGLVYGSGGLIKADAGTLVLTNANTYSGGTTISGGTLQANNTSGSATGTGAVAVNSGGTLSGVPTAVGFANAGTISGIVTVNSGGSVTAASGTTFTFGGLTLNASAASTFQLGATTALPIIHITGTNGLSLAGSSTVNITNAGGLSAGTYRLFDYTGTALANINNLQLGSTPGGGYTYSLSNNQTNTSIDLVVSLSSQQWANDASGNWLVGSNWTNGAYPNAVGAQANFFALINQARTVMVDGAVTAGTLTFNNSNSYTIAGSGVAGQGLTLSNNGTASIRVLLGQHTISAPLTLANDLQITPDNGTALTFSGVLGGAGRAVTTNGVGAVTLSGTAPNTFTGLTTASAGSLYLNKTAGVDAIGSGGLEVDSGATVSLLASNQINDTASVFVHGTLALGSNSEALAALNGSGSVTVSSGGTLTIGSGSNLSSQFDGILSGTGTLVKAGAGTFALTGANTFGGAGQTVRIDVGVLAIGFDGNLGNTANSITLNGGTLALSGPLSSTRAVSLSAASTIDTGVDDSTFSGVVSGAGNLTKNGTGTLSLTGSNSYTGGTTINSGTVVINTASSLGSSSGAVTINAGTLEVATGITGTRNIVLGNVASTIQVDPAQTYSTSGLVSGTGSLNKAGTGTLVLTGANTFNGATVVDEGTLTLAAASGNTLANTSGITVNAGGTLLLGASNQIGNATPVTLDGGTFAKGNFNEGAANAPGMGALTLGGADSHLDFGTGTTGVLTFASFNPNAEQLVIDNWSGTANTLGSGATDRLIFSSSQAANLANFSFTGFADGATQFTLGSGYYEVTPLTPVPEPSTYAAGALAAIGAACEIVRRRRRARKQISQ